MYRDPYFRHASFSAESSEGKVGNKVCKKKKQFNACFRLKLAKHDIATFQNKDGVGLK